MSNTEDFLDPDSLEDDEVAAIVVNINFIISITLTA